MGKLVAKLCADGLKKVTLELGGNCPFIIFDDANLDQALEALFALKWRHAGQACITANRVFVQSGVYDKFASMLVERTKGIKLGHGAEKDTTMGPVTMARALDKADQQVADAKEHGGKIVLGGERLNRDGYFFKPTVITGANNKMLISSEETFAPVMALFSFETEEEVVKEANNTSVSGLGLRRKCTN